MCLRTINNRYLTGMLHFFLDEPPNTCKERERELLPNNYSTKQKKPGRITYANILKRKKLTSLAPTFSVARFIAAQVALLTLRQALLYDER